MNDRPQLLEREWQDLVKKSGLSDASALQKREMRRAFFAGARAYSGLLLKHAEHIDEVTDGDMALMEALEAEMAGFLLDLEAGRA